jgi:hypothetical protein
MTPFSALFWASMGIPIYWGFLKLISIASGRPTLDLGVVVLFSYTYVMIYPRFIRQFYT